jgi:predicted transcriptional regulator
MTDKIVQQNITVPEGGQVVTRLTIAKHLKDHPHVRIFNEALLDVVLDEDLTGQDFRVLFYILSTMEFENFYKQSQKAIADKLGMRQQHVSKSFSKLISKNLLRVIGQIGRQNIYLINPHLAFKSRSNNYKKMLQDWDERSALQAS